MQILNVHEYPKVLPLLIENASTCPTFAYSMIENFISGSVLVDDKHQPKTALVGTKNGVFFIVGNEENKDFNKNFLHFYKQYTRENDLRFTLFSATKDWDKTLKALLINEEIAQMYRYKYAFNPRNHPVNNNELLPNDFNLEEISEKTIEITSNFNKDYYEQYWDGVSNYLKFGFGYCVSHNGKVVSECTSIFASKSIVEIDIVTQKAYTGNGFAYILGKTMIDKCLENGVTPSWDCDANNIASIKLADKLGFDNPEAYSIFCKKE